MQDFHVGPLIKLCPSGKDLNLAENKDKLLCKLILRNFPAPVYQ